MSNSGTFFSVTVIPKLLGHIYCMRKVIKYGQGQYNSGGDTVSDGQESLKTLLSFGWRWLKAAEGWCCL